MYGATPGEASFANKCVLARRLVERGVRHIELYDSDWDQGGLLYGRTDDFGMDIIDAPVHVHDLNATILFLLGLDHERLTYRFQGREFRLTDVHGIVVRSILT